VSRRYDEIRKLGGEVVVITFVTPERLSKHLPLAEVPFPTFADPDRAVYHAFGLGRGPWWRVAGLRTLFGYSRVLLRGWLPRTPVPGDDVLQMGGDFVLDRDNRLRFAHASRDPSDRPSADEVVGAMKAAVA
jgi:peroxiredoxin